MYGKIGFGQSEYGDKTQRNEDILQVIGNEYSSSRNRDSHTLVTDDECEPFITVLSVGHSFYIFSVPVIFI